jgi:3',5'-cyclic AMP phosphodiesterase CpdA
LRSVRALLYRILIVCLVAFPACSDRAGTAAAERLHVVVGATRPPLPLRAASLKFAVIGDSGRWSDQQRETARQLTAQRKEFPFDFVLMLGDNNYGDGSAESYLQRFEIPYKPLLDGAVTFHASLGNHDAGAQWDYPLFNMNGHRYYTFERTSGVLPPLAGERVQFFAADTVNLDDEQLSWLDRELSHSKADWKIMFFHHPIYSSGRYSFSSAARRRTLEQVFIEHEVDLVFSGHEHLYERMKPQSGVMYFVAGGSGSVRQGDLRPGRYMAAGYDRDLTFMLVEIAGDAVYFRTVNRLGEIVDGGKIVRVRTKN